MMIPGWDNAPEWARWVAMDEDGVYWWYQNMPHPFDLPHPYYSYWIDDGEGAAKDSGYQHVYPEINWKTTLEARSE